MYNKKAMIFIINQANLYLKGISKKGDNIMKIYKKLFAYMGDKKISWDLSYSFFYYICCTYSIWILFNLQKFNRKNKNGRRIYLLGGIKWTIKN